MDVIRGYAMPIQHNQRCTGCHKIIGPDSDVRTGFNVKDGEVLGTFHSRWCYEDTRKKFEEFKKKGGGE